MRVVITLLLFLGIFLVTHSVYEAKYRELQSEQKVEYRFVPRTYYEEQLGPAQTDDSGWSTMFGPADFQGLKPAAKPEKN
jgi:hypothetical protein